MRTIHLVGGGPGAMLAMRRHFKAALAEIAKPAPLVAYVGAASGDNVGFQKMIGAAFVACGAKLRPVKLAAKTAKVSAARTLLEDCDMVFLSGGDVHAGMTVLEERGVLPLFRDLARVGRPMMGVSAGSLMLGKEWVHFPDEDDDTKAEPFECIGAAPIHVDAHSEEDDWSELRTLVALLARRGDPDPVGYGLPRMGCLRLSFEGDAVKLEPRGVDIPRIVAKHGKVAKGAPLRVRRSGS